MLRVQGITVAISAVTILRGLSLRVDTGDIVGLVGRNGAGKTTTLRSIMGLTHLSAGRIELDGSLLDGMPSYTRARLGIGYLPEDRRLVPALSVYNNLLIPAQASGIADHDERLRRIFDLIPELSAQGKHAERRAAKVGGAGTRFCERPQAAPSGRTVRRSLNRIVAATGANHPGVQAGRRRGRRSARRRIRPQASRHAHAARVRDRARRGDRRSGFAASSVYLPLLGGGMEYPPRGGAICRCCGCYCDSCRTSSPSAASTACMRTASRSPEKTWRSTMVSVPLRAAAT